MIPYVLPLGEPRIILAPLTRESPQGSGAEDFLTVQVGKQRAMFRDKAMASSNDSILAPGFSLREKRNILKRTIESTVYCVVCISLI